MTRGHCKRIREMVTRDKITESEMKRMRGKYIYLREIQLDVVLLDSLISISKEAKGKEDEEEERDPPHVMRRLECVQRPSPSDLKLRTGSCDIITRQKIRKEEMMRGSGGDVPHGFQKSERETQGSKRRMRRRMR